MAELFRPAEEGIDLDALNEEELRAFCYGALQMVVSLQRKVDKLEADKIQLKYELHDARLSAEEEKKFDQKTGLLIAAAFREATEERMEKRQQDARHNWRRRNVSDNTTQYLLFMDLDHFKKLNEVLNHEVVDEKLLLPAVEHLNSAVRGDDDLIGRQGGDEFLVLLMGVDKDSCSKIARRIQSGINEIIIPQTGPYPQLWRNLGVSIGIAEFHHDSDYGEVFSQAHAAHLVSKENPRRNQIVFAD